jgi:hypothetical protein
LQRKIQLEVDKPYTFVSNQKYPQLHRELRRNDVLISAPPRWSKHPSMPCTQIVRCEPIKLKQPGKPRDSRGNRFDSAMGSPALDATRKNAAHPCQQTEKHCW